MSYAFGQTDRQTDRQTDLNALPSHSSAGTRLVTLILYTASGNEI